MCVCVCGCACMCVYVCACVRECVCLFVWFGGALLLGEKVHASPIALELNAT